MSQLMESKTGDKHDVGFYLMTQKGYIVLTEFVDAFGEQALGYVISSQDKHVAEDYYKTIEQFCLDRDIPFYNRQHTPEALSTPTLRFAIGWRWLIPQAHDLIVLHDSLLPKYRGFAPVVSALINGDNRIGVTALLAEKEYDTGDIIAQKAVDITYPIKIAEAIEQLAYLYAQLVKNIYADHLQGKTVQPIPQDHAAATYSLWRDERDYCIDWNDDANRIKRQIDALGFPYAGAKALMNGEVVRLTDAEVVDDVVIENRKNAIGKVLSVADGDPIVICKKGLIRLLGIEKVNADECVLPLKKFRTRFD